MQNKEYLFEAHAFLIQDVNFVQQFTKFLTFTKCNNKWLSNALHRTKTGIYRETNIFNNFNGIVNLYINCICVREYVHYIELPSDERTATDSVLLCSNLFRYLLLIAIKTR